MPCPNPLTPEQCHVLTRVIQHLHDTRELINKIQSCGIDLPDKLGNNAAQMELSVALRNAFFPNGPDGGV